ncbi:MAG TPA: DUF4351 domain-containing protein, partial [Pirellulales bacterium]
SGASYMEANKMRASSRELGIREGRERGRQEGQQEGRQEERRELLGVLLEQRFGRLSRRAIRRIESLPAEEMRDLFNRALQAESLRELGLAD